jgi:ABC-2 type transport system permease protein
VAGRLAPLLLRMLPILVLAWAVMGLRAPASPQAALLWLLGTAGALALAASVSALMTISLLWTISGEGINRLVPSALFIFSGLVVPLPLFPDFLQPLVQSLPFRGLADTPYRLYLGLLTGREALHALAHQAAWTLALMALGAALLRRGLRRLIVQGG